MFLSDSLNVLHWMSFNCLMAHLDDKSAMGSGNGLVLSVEVNGVFFSPLVSMDYIRKIS